jgi:REP element-mobilizing transposase RayT
MLFGADPVSGYNFDHRRQWIEARLIELANIFSIDIFGYAVMSNHYHIVLELKPNTTQDWSDEEVVRRWINLNPRVREDLAATTTRAKILLADKTRILELRERLGSLSWFMRYLNEPLARLANKEDDCTGRFWEGRFKSQRLLDESAIIACMVYVDLNPVRAGLTSDAEKAEYTSFVQRLNEAEGTNSSMTTINKPNKPLPFRYSLKEYSALLDWTALTQASVRLGGKFDPSATHSWLEQALPRPERWQRALGSSQSIKAYASGLGQRWIRTYTAQLLT